MADKIQSNRIICEGGLDSTENHLKIAEEKPGSITRGINYEVGLTGGYRKINGYQAMAGGAIGGDDAEGRVLGIAIFDNSTTGNTEIIAARKQAGNNEYDFYLFNGTGWTVITTGLTKLSTSGGRTVTKLRWDVGHDGADNYIVFADGVNKATIYDGTTWGEISSSASGADIANAGGDQAINIPSVVAFFSETFFLSGDPTAEGIVSYCAPREFFKWTAAAGGGQATPGMGVMQIKPFRDSLYVFGSNRIRKLNPDVDAGFVLNDVTSNIGLAAADSVMEVGGDLVFLAPDGFRPISGTNKIGDVQLETISKSIQNLINRRITGNDMTTVNTVVIRGKSQFRLTIGSDTLEVADSTGITGCLRTPDTQNGWEFFELRGFRASCMTSRYIDNEEIVLHGDYNGIVYRQEMGNNLAGASMISQLSTPYLDFGDTEIRKIMDQITVFFKPEGSAMVGLSIDYDWGLPGIPHPNNYDMSISANPAQYGTENEYGDGSVYGGLVIPVARKKLEGSFRSVRFTFVTNGTDDVSFSVHGFVLAYQVAGRR